MRKILQFDVSGQHMVFEYSMKGWKTYYSGDDGKRIPANVTIPSHYTVKDIAQYLDNRFHESATEIHSKVRKI